jgi:hypothetical protein
MHGLKVVLAAFLLAATAMLSAGSAAALSPAATSASAPTSVSTSAPQGKRTQVVHNCTNYRVKPKDNIVFACADGYLYLSGMHWSSWHKHNAYGHGYLWLNGCKPNCAEGKMHHYRVRVHLNRAYLQRQHRVFHRAHIRFTGHKPSGWRHLRNLRLPGRPV